MHSIECQVRLNEAILRLETSSKRQTDINEMYSDFVTAVKMEMVQNLNPRHIRLQDSATSNKRRRSRKPWWTEELSRLWKNMCSAEKNGGTKLQFHGERNGFMWPIIQRSYFFIQIGKKLRAHKRCINRLF